MNGAHIPPPKIETYGLVRGPDGKPKIAGDPRNLHPKIKQMLTSDECRELGIEKET